MPSPRFDLDAALAAWRRPLDQHRAFLPGDVDELEEHLRDHIDRLQADGLDAQTAFREATARMGAIVDLEPEYEKVRWTKHRHRRNLWHELLAEQTMLKNYLTIARRTLRRHKGYAFINILGLAVGLACCLLIGQYVLHEWSFDRYHEHADRTFRLVFEEHGEDWSDYSARGPVPLGPTLQADYPEVDAVVRFWRGAATVLGHEQTFFQEPDLYFTDPAVFEVFDLNLIAGNPATALVNPGSIVLTESMARRYFGDTNPMGEVLSHDGYPGPDSLTFTVTGIIQDLPTNTHLSFTALAALEGIETEQDNWGSFKPIWTYVLLPDGAAAAAVEAKLTDFVTRHAISEDTFRFHLEPITAIHLGSVYRGAFKPGSNRTYVSLMGLIGLSILLLACANFINLSTARSLRRAREVGVRKVMGAQRRQLVMQFLGEALLLTSVAVVVALGLQALLAEVLTRLGLVAAFAAPSIGWLALILLGLVLLVTLLAGLYPAFVLSRFHPAVALQGLKKARPSGVNLRQGLVVFQFAVSILLILSTAMIHQQLDYLRQKNLGFDKEQVVVVPYSPNEVPLLDALRQHAGVVSAAVSQRVPVNLQRSDTRPVLPEGFDEAVSAESYIVDPAFLETYAMPMVAGRGLAERAGDQESFIINEAAVERFGWGSPEEALGRTLTWTNGPTEGPVVGVVQDFHLKSMHEEIAPLVMHQRPDEQWWRSFISVKIRPDQVGETLAFIEATWKALTPEGAYAHFFIDDSFAQLHEAEARLEQLVGIFAFLAVLVACLGLFGLAAFLAEQRTKEIGVRKVLGATVSGIVLLLSKDFLKLVLIAFLLAGPIAYFIMQDWLTNFAYHTTLAPGLFVGVGAAALLLALLTVSYQSIRAATADPVKSLRYE